MMRRERARPPWGVVKDARRRARGATGAEETRRARAASFAKKHCVSLGRSFECKPCETLRPGVGFSFTRARVTVLVVTSRGCGDVFVVAPPNASALVGHSSARPRETSRAVALAFRGNAKYDRAPRGARKMDLEAGQAVVPTIPVAALVPAKMLVDQAVHIVGRHAVVSPGVSSLEPRTARCSLVLPRSSLAPRPELTPPTAPASSPGAAISRARAPEPRSAAAAAPLPRCAARRAFPPRTTRSPIFSRVLRTSTIRLVSDETQKPKTFSRGAAAASKSALAKPSERHFLTRNPSETPPVRG